METAASKAVFRVDLYAPSFTFVGGMNGLNTKGEMSFFPGVKT